MAKPKMNCTTVCITVSGTARLRKGSRKANIDLETDLVYSSTRITTRNSTSKIVVWPILEAMMRDNMIRTEDQEIT